jgi:hypothetical protein
MWMPPEYLKTRRGQLTMASTQITVENLTLIPIYALVTWAGGHIGGVRIQGPKTPARRPGAEGTGYDRADFQSGSIPCEWVWYDLKVLDPNGLRSDGTGVVGGYTFAQRQTRGGTSWIFEPAPLGGYQLRER